MACCLALWQQRPQDVIRIYVTEQSCKQFGAMLKWAAAQRLAYHLVPEEDLQRLTESIHHQGICVLAREPVACEFAQLHSALASRDGPHLLGYLDGVENPHNLGAVVRSCAHFGVEYLLGEQGRLPRMSPSACRIAEGGAEHVQLVLLQDRDVELNALHAQGFQLIAAGADGEPLYDQPLPARSVLVMGAEGGGVSSGLRARADRIVAIPGSGQVESLNVSVAFAVIAAEYTRQRLQRPRSDSRSDSRYGGRPAVRPSNRNGARR